MVVIESTSDTVASCIEILDVLLMATSASGSELDDMVLCVSIICLALDIHEAVNCNITAAFRI